MLDAENFCVTVRIDDNNESMTFTDDFDSKSAYDLAQKILTREEYFKIELECNSVCLKDDEDNVAYRKDFRYWDVARDAAKWLATVQELVFKPNPIRYSICW